MNKTIQGELQSRIEAFATDITTILQRAVAASIAATLADARASKSAGRGRAKGKAARKGSKVAVDLDVLLREVTKVGGRRVEEIANSLGIPSKSVGPAMKKLLVAKKVKAKGKARGTRYTAS